MTTPDGTSGDVAATTALLQAELPRLEEQQQTLEKDLASVTARLESVRSALTALQTLSATPPVPSRAEPDGKGKSASNVSADAEAEITPGPKALSQGQEAPAPGRGRTGRKSVKPSDEVGTPPRRQKERPAKKASAKPAKKASSAPPAHDSGSLTEQIMEVVAASGNKAVRARDVAEALGRELTTGSINTVRSTLDRLVATSRAHRAGRGLYQAPLK